MLATSWYCSCVVKNLHHSGQFTAFYTLAAATLASDNSAFCICIIALCKFALCRFALSRFALFKFPLCKFPLCIFALCKFALFKLKFIFCPSLQCLLDLCLYITTSADAGTFFTFFTKHIQSRKKKTCSYCQYIKMGRQLSRKS